VPSKPTARQRLSKALFGQLHRLDVMIAIMESDGYVSPTYLSERLHLPQSALQAPLRDLLAGGLLEYVDVRERRNIYKAADSLVWPWIDELKQLAETTEKASEPVRRLMGTS
jgi:predicted transcriptional regulator